MASFKLTFRSCIRDSEEFGSNDDQMVSRVFFTLAVDGTVVGDFSADLKQFVPEGGESGQIEVVTPIGFDGSFDTEQFVDAVRDYFDDLVGHHRRKVHIAGVGYVRARNKRYDVERVFEFDSQKT